MPQKYDTIIFDLGGVLYDIDVQLTKNAFASLGISDFERLYTLKEQTVLFDALEKGTISEEEFVAGINKAAHAELTFEEVKNAWEALLIGMPKESVTLLKDLKRAGYKLYLLSNTNIFHYNFINNEMRNKFGIDKLADLFDEAYYSFKIGMRKPEIEIYEYVIHNHGLSLERTVFIDDNEDNIKGALKAGIQGIYKTKDLSLNKLVNQLLQ
jgi:HAD superfamily hydrolase (TIGR01549 family)